MQKLFVGREELETLAAFHCRVLLAAAVCEVGLITSLVEEKDHHGLHGGCGTVCPRAGVCGT